MTTKLRYAEGVLSVEEAVFLRASYNGAAKSLSILAQHLADSGVLTGAVLQLMAPGFVEVIEHVPEATPAEGAESPEAPPSDATAGSDTGSPASA